MAHAVTAFAKPPVKAGGNDSAHTEESPGAMAGAAAQRSTRVADSVRGN